MYRIAQSPQSIGGVLDDGFKLFGSSFAKVVVFAFLAMLAGQLPNMFMPADPAAMASFGTNLMLAVLVSMVISALFYGAIVVRMDAMAHDREMSAGEAMAAGAKRLLPLVVFTVLYMLIVILGSLLLLIPGIIFSISLMFGMFVVLLERGGPVEAIKASHRMVWGNWWRTFVIISVATIVMMVVYLLVGFAAGLVAAIGGGSAGSLQIIQLVLVPALGAVILPLFYAILLATYYDLKVRRSGADLEQRLGAPAEA